MLDLTSSLSSGAPAGSSSLRTSLKLQSCLQELVIGGVRVEDGAVVVGDVEVGANSVLVVVEAFRVVVVVGTFSG